MTLSRKRKKNKTYTKQSETIVQPTVRLSYDRINSFPQSFYFLPKNSAYIWKPIAWYQQTKYKISEKKSYADKLFPIIIPETIF